MNVSKSGVAANWFQLIYRLETTLKIERQVLSQMNDSRLPRTGVQSCLQSGHLLAMTGLLTFILQNFHHLTRYFDSAVCFPGGKRYEDTNLSTQPFFPSFWEDFREALLGTAAWWRSYRSETVIMKNKSSDRRLWWPEFCLFCFWFRFRGSFLLIWLNVPIIVSSPAMKIADRDFNRNLRNLQQLNG